jgi:hypothetical protein
VRHLGIGAAVKLERAQARPVEVRVDHPVRRDAEPLVGGLLQVEIPQHGMRRQHLGDEHRWPGKAHSLRIAEVRNDDIGFQRTIVPPGVNCCHPFAGS